MSEEEQPLTPHPDKILDDAKEIINKAGNSATVLELLQIFQPVVSLVIIMRGSFKTAGFSDDAIDQMILAIWYKFFPPSYYEGSYGAIDEDE